jgi:hypothetical protein
MLKELKSNITNEEVTNVAMLWSYEVLTQLIDEHVTLCSKGDNHS